MPGWEGSDRRQRLPSNWDSIRARILRRDSHRCTWIENSQRCAETATDVDHRKAGDDHSDSNLRSLCGKHHRRKSAREGAAAANRLRSLRYRKPERHPGLIGE